jgi:sulfide:quinone oxidoreductase
VQGLPVSEHGFIRVDPSGQVPGSGPVFAAGDAVDFPIKHGGVGSQRADCVAEAIAALAGADIQPRAFEPEIYGVLLTDDKPRYIHARLTGGHGFESEFSETPIDGHTNKISARYLGPYLERLVAA